MATAAIDPRSVALSDRARTLAIASGVRLVVLFGSLARGEGRPDSDADIGMIGGEFWDQLSLGTEIGKLLGREPHVVDLSAAGETLRYLVARDGIPLVDSEPSGWARFQAEATVRYLDFVPTLKTCAEGARRRIREDVNG